MGAGDFPWEKLIRGMEGFSAKEKPDTPGRVAAFVHRAGAANGGGS